MTTCSFPGCGDPVRAKGLCNAHWKQQHQGKELSPKSRRPGRTCDFPGCDRPHRKRGWCSAHEQQERKWGRGKMLPIGLKPRGIPPVTSSTYTAVHQRLREWLGPAKLYACVRCGATAADWSYVGGATEPLFETNRSGRVVEYSGDLRDYETLCRSCHTSVDRYAEPRTKRPA